MLTSSGVSKPDKHVLPTSIRQHAAPTRAFTSLGWLVRNLRLPFDVTEVAKPRSGPGARLGQGQAQAATLDGAAPFGHAGNGYCKPTLALDLLRVCNVLRSRPLHAPSTQLSCGRQWRQSSSFGAPRAKPEAEVALHGVCLATAAPWVTASTRYTTSLRARLPPVALAWFGFCDSSTR